MSLTPFFAAQGNTPINLTGNRRLGNATFQASSSTIRLASSNDSGGDGDNGQLLGGSGNMGIDDDALAFLVGGGLLMLCWLA
jgi:hypothetical protein